MDLINNKIIPGVLVVAGLFFYLMGAFATSSEDLADFAVNVCMFNIAFSVGLAAILIAATALPQRSQTKRIKQKVTRFLGEFLSFITANFLLLLTTFWGNAIAVHLFLGVAFITVFIIIFGAKSLILLMIEKIEP